MRIDVLRGPDNPNTNAHEAEWLETDSRDGELRITERDRDGGLLSYTLYAAGWWMQAKLVEPAAPDVAQHRALIEQRDRATGNEALRLPGALGNSGPH